MFESEGLEILESFFLKESCDHLVVTLKSILKNKYTSISAIFQSDLIVPEVSEILHNPKLLKLVEEKMQSKPVLISSGFYVHGSETFPHHEAIRYSSEPKNKLIGVWIALEDVFPTNGPFYYYPGTHQQNYLNLKERIKKTGITSKNEDSDKLESEAFLESELKQDLCNFNTKELVRHLFLANKGDLIIMDGRLLHGGQKILNFNKERPALVGYYLPNDEKKYFFPDFPESLEARTISKLREDISTTIKLKKYETEKTQVMKTPERTLSPVNAIENIYQFYLKNGYHVQLNCIGEQPVTYECQISHKDWKSSFGIGKGAHPQQSMASALFEAFEHLVMHGDLVDESASLFMSIKSALSKWNCYPKDLLEKNKEIEDELLWDIFEGLNTEEKLLIPSFIVESTGGTIRYHGKCRAQRGSFPFQKLEGAYSNSGTATGSTKEEAILHGINELVERDAFSILLIETFCKKTPRILRIIDKETLPDYLKNLLQLCESETGKPITILNMTTELGIPSITCFCLNKVDESRFLFGFGSSPSAEYAIERALLETLQLFHNNIKYKDECEQDWKEAYRFAEGMPKLKACADRNFQSIIDKGFYHYMDFKNLVDLSSNNFNISGKNFIPTDTLRNILNHFKNLDINVYVKVLFQDEKYKIFCTKCVIRELEVFDLVTYGLLPIPGERGKLALSQE